MIPALVGSAAIALIVPAEIAALRRLPRLRAILWALSGAGFLAAVAWAALAWPRLALPPALGAAGAALGAAGTALAVRSLFLELPFAATYAGAARPPSLVRTGTYALVRHPVALWLPLALGGLVLATGSVTLLYCSPLWVTLNLACVLLQDRIFFPRIFGEAYRDYQREVPMIIPSPASLRRSLATFRWRKP